MSEYATFTAAGSELEVVNVDGHEGVSQHFVISVTCRTGDGKASPEPRSLAGGEASLTLSDGGRATRTVRGVVSRAQTSHHDDGTIILTTEMRPAAHMLTLGRNCRAFIDKTVVDIVTEVLAGVPHRWEVGASFPMRAYTVQYREDDWTFVARLLEQEGIYYWFDHAAGSQIVFADASPGAPDLVGGSDIRFHRSTGMVPDREVIMELGGVARMTPTAFAVRSFNPDNPALEVAGSAGSGNLEFYDAPGGGPTDPAQAQRQADLLQGAAGAAARGVNGKTNSVRVAPGRVLAVSGHPLASLDAAYFITAARYRVRQRRRGGAGEVERAYDYWFAGLPKATPYVPPRLTPPAQQAGIQTGVVGGPPGQEIFPDETGRVRVQQHWDRQGARDDKSGTWMRVAQRGTNDSMQLPRTGWNVLTFNEEGAVDAPSVLSRVNDGEHPPAYALPANKTRVVYKTATSPADGSFNEVYFEDTQGAEEMFINASRDMNILVQHAKVEAIDHDQLRTVGVDHTLVVMDDRTEEVGVDQTVMVGANDDLTSGAGHKESVGANLTINIGGNRKIVAGSDAGLTALGNHNASIGAARIDTCLGDISGSAKLFTLMAGAAQLKLAAKGIAEQCGGVAVQTIGGAKLEFTKASRTVNVDKMMVETVGGLMMLKADGTYIDGATKTSAWTTGLKMSTKAADSTLINATEKIVVKCGGSSITIEPEKLTIETKKLVLADADAVKIETGEIEHN